MSMQSQLPPGTLTIQHTDHITKRGLTLCRRHDRNKNAPAVRLPGPIVCVENHATFRTMLRFLRDRPRPRWAAVAWVQGRNTAPLESLPSLPFPVSRLDYLGDFDAAGLEIAM